MSTYFCPPCDAQVAGTPVDAGIFALMTCAQCGIGLKATPQRLLSAWVSSAKSEQPIEPSFVEEPMAIEEPVIVEESDATEDPVAEEAPAESTVESPRAEYESDDSLIDESTDGSMAETSVVDESLAGESVDEDSVVTSGPDDSIGDGSVIDESLLGVSQSESVDVSSDISVIQPVAPSDAATEGAPDSRTGISPQARIFATSTSPELLESLWGHLGEAKWAQGLKTNICGADTIEVITECFLSGGRIRLLLIQQELDDLSGLELCYAYRAIEAAFGVDKSAPILLFGDASLQATVQDAISELSQTKFVPMKSSATAEQNAERMATIVQRLIKAASRSK